KDGRPDQLGMLQRERGGEQRTAGMAREVHPTLEADGPQEPVGVLHQRVEGIFGFAARVVGVALAELVDGEDVEVPRQNGQVQAPGVQGVEGPKELATTHQDEGLASAVLVVASAHSIDVDEVKLRLIQ